MKPRIVLLSPALLLSLGIVTCAGARSDTAQPKMSYLGVEIPTVVSRSFGMGHSDPSRLLHISVSLPPRDSQGLQAYADSVSNPTSPNYHRFISPEEVGRKFGLPVNAINSVVGHLKTNGMTIRLIGKNRLSILADGTVSQAEKAFQTTINEYSTIFRDEAGKSEYFSFAKPLQVPSSLAHYVVDVQGLQSFTRPQPRALTPTQARSLYSLATSYSSGYQGQGRVTAISNWDGFQPANVPLYYNQFSLPVPVAGVGTNIHIVPVSGGAQFDFAQGEGDLDIQMVLGMAPLSDLYVYDGGGSDLIGVLTQEVNDNIADVISESWGWNLDASTAAAAHNLHLSMTAQGITYMAASGDNGTSIEPYSYPDCDPEVLSVGGTVATVTSLGNRSTEQGWSGSGGGWSTNGASFNLRPSWQSGTGVPTTFNYRMFPDVAIHASSPSGAYQFFFNGAITGGYVGTSFACPVFCGSLAVAEQRIIASGGLLADGAGKQRFGRIQDLIYAQNGRADVWYDIKTGSNGKLPSGATSTSKVGWDTVTGWGAINFEGFIASQAPAIIPSVPANPMATAGVNQISLVWSSSTGATSYKILRSLTSGGPYSQAGTSVATGFLDKSVTSGNTYFYVIVGSNATGNSAYSSEVFASPTAPVELLLNGGFESGRVNWVGVLGTINSLGLTQTHSGAWAATLGGRGIKGSYVLYQEVAIPASITKATLSYWVRVDTAETGLVANDKFGVTIRNTANLAVQWVGSFSNLTPTNGYVFKTYDVTAQKGKTVRVYLYALENASLATTFYLDDFSLTVQ